MRTKILTLCLTLVAFGLIPSAKAQLIYTTNSGAITITGFTGSPTSVIIQPSINGYPVTSIGDEAFEDCTNLTSVTIPNSVTSIGDEAFRNCTSLMSVTIGNSVTSIGELAFDFCTSLTSVTIPNSVTSIGDRAFEACLSLTSFTIPNNVTSIEDEVFEECTSLTSITIPNSVTSIGELAFYECYSLTSVTIGNSVTSIGFDAFSECYSLTSVIIPNSVTSIGGSAFSECYSLTSVTIGNSVTSLGEEAFDLCTSVTNVTFLGNAPVLTDAHEFLDDRVAAKVVYYYYGTSGWSSTYGSLPTVELFAPSTPPQIGNGSIGVSAGSFGFTVTGVTNQTIVVVATTNLVNWQPIWTNTLSGTSAIFTDPQWTNYPRRFYRAQ